MAVKEEKKNGKNYCTKCGKCYCSGCMQEWNPIWGWNVLHSHCVQTSYKGETKSKAEQFLKHLEFLNLDFPKFIQEKTQKEEELRELGIYFEEKLEASKEGDEFEKEEAVEYLDFLDALNGFINNTFFFLTY